MPPTLQHLGKLVDDTDIDGERRCDGVAPAHGNGLQLSRDRFLLLVSTLAFRGVDDSLSITWQLRAGSYAGPVLRSGVFAKSVNDWDVLGNGGKYVRQFGHPVAFGVPKGAVQRGQPLPHANVFAVKFRQCARTLAPEGHLLWNHEDAHMAARSQDVLWVQFRLNDAEDDLEILQPMTPLRQVGYSTWEQPCAHGDMRAINQTYVQPVVASADGSVWADVLYGKFNDHAVSGRDANAAGPVLIPCRYQFNAARGLYEWVEVGPTFGAGRYFEPSLLPYGDDWLVAARPVALGPIGWFRSSDPFAGRWQHHEPTDITCRNPLAAYACPDGQVRLLAGDPARSPHGSNRNPLYCFEIDPDHGCRAAAVQTVFDTYAAGVPIAREHGPLIDMPKLLPHAGGNMQTLIHRVRSCAFRFEELDYGGPVKLLTEGDFASTAIYHASLRYEQEYPGCWTFA